MQLLQWQIKGTNNSENCSICGQYEKTKNDCDFYILNCTRIFCRLSASSTMSQNFTPALLYRYQRRRQHRRQHRNSAAISSIQPSVGTKPSDICHSAISSEAPSMASQGQMVSVPEDASEAGSEKAFKSDVDRVLNVRPVNDSFSSSKSNMELSSASLKTNTDDAGECSSSGAATAEKVTNGMSERDICISIFRSQGVLDRILGRQDLDASDNTDLVNGNYCSKFCKVCEKLENTAKLLICDNCEDAFHKFCCNPVVKRIPVGEWLCKSCLKKKRKIMNKKSTSSANHISTEIGRNGTASEDEVGSLEFMFTDTEPYISNVRIGDEFQADVPRWSGPIDDASDLIGDPLEMDSSNNVAMPVNVPMRVNVGRRVNVAMQEQNPTRDFKFNPIGNWLQCQQVIEGTGQDHDETICGKWRRAPLFEVQTDNWECFRCVLWNPAQADCSVPQELETVEVMRQLKYIEMLGPRLGDKRR